ncbi:MAG: radical SAM protein [Alphaproteobacteria bacterium]|nr:radical SAM protein [Alphaproteobacteria bacterium]
MSDNRFKMSGHKLYWHLERVAAWQRGEDIVPLYFDMGITQTCNIACEYCYYAVPENRTKEAIPTGRLITFLQEAAEVGVKAIGFLGDGEPMVHPGVYDAVIAGRAAGLDMAISTNGVVMKEDRLADFLAALKWIRFNISAVTPDSYARVMGAKPHILDKVVANIRRTVDIVKREGLETTVGLQMVLVSDCVDQIVPFAKFGREIGVDYAVIKQCSEHGSLPHGLIIDDAEEHEDKFTEAEAYATDKYSVIIKRRKMMQKARTYDKCFGTWFLPQITGAGDIYVCGNFFGNEKFYLGSIVTDSFKRIVSSREYAEVMRRVASQVDVHKECGLGCRQNEINEFLWAIHQTPEHVNFI